MTEPCQAVRSHALESPRRLHNSGGYPYARLVWRGLRALPGQSEEDRIAVAARHGFWLQLRFLLGPRHPFYGHEWNSACRLLSVLEGEHQLDERGARERLLECIEAHAARLDWPRVLLADDGKGHHDALVLDDALTAFVALSKSTGAIWLRDRPPVLAPLHTPIDWPGSGGTGYGRSIEWSTALWFPDGVPGTLLQAVRHRPQAKEAR